MATTIMMFAVATIVIVGSVGSYIAVTEVNSTKQAVDLTAVCEEQCIEDVACHIEGEQVVCDMNISMDEPSYDECMATCRGA